MVKAGDLKLVSCSTPKIQVTCSSETSVYFHRTTRRYIPEDWILWELQILRTTKKGFIFWDITPRILLKVNRRFGGIYVLHLQSWRVSQAIRQLWSLSASCLSLRSWRLRRHVRLTFTGLHCDISQNTELFIFSAVRTWNPTKMLSGELGIPLNVGQHWWDTKQL
jgi:hypothetical protein